MGNISSANPNDIINIEINLHRLYINHLINTFLPTSCLVTLSVVTLFFNENYIDLSMGFSLTIILVLSTMNQSISSGSPKTNQVKLLDIWIIFCLIAPISIFLLQILWKFHLTYGKDSTNLTAKFPCLRFFNKRSQRLCIVTCCIVFVVGYFLRVSLFEKYAIFKN